eukprot:4839573-Prymnesium_polylepis.1
MSARRRRGAGTCPSSSRWPLAYDAPCGCSGRYARPAVPWLARDTCHPGGLCMAYDAPCGGSGRYARPAV